MRGGGWPKRGGGFDGPAVLQWVSWLVFRLLPRLPRLQGAQSPNLHASPAAAEVEAVHDVAEQQAVFLFASIRYEVLADELRR